MKSRTPVSGRNHLGGRPWTGQLVRLVNAGTTDVIKSAAAEIFDLLLRPPAPGKYTIAVDYLHWITGQTLATRTVTVTAA